VAVSDDPRDDWLERDPRLARVLETAGGEEPSAALDAAILAAARRAAQARPQAVGGGGEITVPAVRPKRSWYVPVSIAAVLVLSVSLVKLVHQEKGDELAQPSGSTPDMAQAPTSLPPPAAAPEPAAQKAESAARNVEPDQPQAAEQKRSEAAPKSAGMDATGTVAKPQRKQTEKAVPMADSAAGVSKGVAAVPGAAGDSAAVTPPAAPAASALAKERRAEPFPSSGEREAPPAAAREAGRLRPESDSGAARDAAPPVARAVPGAVSPRQDGVAEETRPRSAPSFAQGRTTAAPLPPPMVAAKPLSKRAEAQSMARPAWLAELDNQPPEKWLEQLAVFKRDGRTNDAEVLLNEFRRRFPDHPASVR